MQALKLGTRNFGRQYGVPAKIQVSNVPSSGDSPVFINTPQDILDTQRIERIVIQKSSPRSNGMSKSMTSTMWTSEFSGVGIEISTVPTDRCSREPNLKIGRSCVES
jgi:hypothetical protein